MEKQLMTIRAWKDAEYRATLTPEQLALIEPNPIGAALTEEELTQHTGGEAFEDVVGPGWWPTISGECNGGYCCNPFGSGR
ncbi:mersacidin/lichenicidin family type 2 lantibiotic [Hymenobacter chitinivorans]|uniref:Mersacidin/lichenicidin family type 2 lantibiotic n=1 Tax=Hymenobacter chitinivorans DSM 11115 TaxID=1121954 RepID=A0A2M9B4R3_9BACT|nr:mersacidin/lichenicidin family type 2 lantibiotic [Hymenobacter chitinivorans]PJJ52928.1 mersacidin/lichenicidin family type 2 lantibiotic [Hymenobacter chitinivorans DSM 11115]